MNGYTWVSLRSLPALLASPISPLPRGSGLDLPPSGPRKSSPVATSPPGIWGNTLPLNATSPLPMRKPRPRDRGRGAASAPRAPQENRLSRSPQGLEEVGGAGWAGLPGRGQGRGTQRQGERADREGAREGAGCPGRQLPRGFRESGGGPLSWLPSARLGGVEAVHKAAKEGPGSRDPEALQRTLQTGKKGEPRGWGVGWLGNARAASRSEQSQHGGGLGVWGVTWPDFLGLQLPGPGSASWAGVMPKATLGAFPLSWPWLMPQGHGADSRVGGSSTHLSPSLWPGPRPPPSSSRGAQRTKKRKKPPSPQEQHRKAL